MALVLVDAENVRRSEWPNIGRGRIVAAVAAWAEAQGHEAVVVFDGAAPEGGVGTGAASADDWIAARVREVEGEVWVVTSDRELRRRVTPRAARLLGGGSFARELRRYRD